MYIYCASTAILTTQNPEAFVIYEYQTPDTSRWIVPKTNVSNLWINGMKPILNTDASLVKMVKHALKLDVDVSAAVFHIYTRDVSDFDAKLWFEAYTMLSPTTAVLDSSVTVLLHNRPNIINGGELNIYQSQNILVEQEASYLILRTNPKFTGNVKLIVDSSYNMYLDTFKVSDILSNKMYRKQQVSGNSNLSSDIRKTFSSLPLGELYRNDVEDTLNVSIPKTELSRQYITTYNYGAKLFEDELYDQDYSLLAPLWLNQRIPDYFCIFRMPGVFNQETYLGNPLDELAFKYLEESDVIKTWSLKPTSPLGTYLQTHVNDFKNYPAPVFLSLTDPNIQNAESDPNTWYGIAVDKGIVTGRSETPYFFNQKIDNFTNLNAFVSDGFERNSLLCHNLINLEYIFDDNDVSLYTMNRYFGMYLTENVLYDIAYYADASGSATRILSLDGRESSTFINSVIFDSLGDVSTNYKNRLFVLNDGITLNRITNNQEINGTSDSVKEYINKPYKNLFEVSVEKKELNPFITLTLNNLLNSGEQLRIINKNQNKIWELYGIDTSASCAPYIITSSEVGYPTIYQTVFNVAGSISDQIKSIEAAIDRFQDYEDSYFRAGIRTGNHVSIILNDNANVNEKWQFQRITSQIQSNIDDINSDFNSSASPSDITFHGMFTPNASDFETIRYDASYGPINFELFGNRRSITLDLFDTNNYLYSFSPKVRDNSTYIFDRFEDFTMYQAEDYWYRLIVGFDVSNNSYQYIQDPLSLDADYLIQTESLVKTLNGKWNAYSIYPLSISLMGINPVNDIDYTVYDACIGSRSEYWYAREGDASANSLYIEIDGNDYIVPKSDYVIQYGIGTLTIGDSSIEYTGGEKFNTFDCSAYIVATTPTLISYPILNGSHDYVSYDASISEEDVSDYFYSNKLMTNSLTSPTVSKWVGLGTDCRNNRFRLVTSLSMFDPAESSSNFIPDASMYYDELTYPVFKYLTPGTKNWEDYIYNDINDTVKYTDDQGIHYKTVKQLMLDEPYVDMFSKLVFSNKNVDKVKNRSTLVYYNQYKDMVDTLFLGLNLSLYVSVRAKSYIDIKNYHMYKFSFISTSSKNRDSLKPIEIIINENMKTILMVWYQGSDVLNYTNRNSTYVPGKSWLENSDSLDYYKGFNDSSEWSFAKTPFIVNNSGVNKTLVDIFDFKSNWNYDSSLIRPYCQLNYNTNNINSIWTAYTLNNNIINLRTFSTADSFNTFSQKVEYSYLPNINTYGDTVINYGYKYKTNENLYTNNVCNLHTLNHLLAYPDNYVMCYILRNDETLTNGDFGFSPINVRVNSPRSFNGIMTYNGWYTPKFDWILDFKTNEEYELIDIVKKDFMLNNTNLRTYNGIDQLWYNKVVYAVSTTDVEDGNAISYHSNYNVFKSQWDANYYTYREQDASSFTTIDGFESSKELPAFFGSKLIKMPNTLDLENWNSVSARYTSDDDNHILSFNITRTIIDIFTNNSTFVNNWTGLTYGTQLNEYIKDTVVGYYNISVPKIKVEYYHKPFDTQRLAYVHDDNLVLNDKQNFDAQLYYENDEYIYRIMIPKGDNYTYFVKIILTEK